MNKLETKFKIGDKVEIVNYGHLIFYAGNSGIEYDILSRTCPVVAILDNGTKAFDLNPKLIGEQGVIKEVDDSDETVTKYALDGLNKASWYNDDQLQLVSPTTDVAEILMPQEFMLALPDDKCDLAMSPVNWEKVWELMLEYSEYVRRQECKIREQSLTSNIDLWGKLQEGWNTENLE